MDRTSLTWHDIPLSPGLNTQWRPEQTTLRAYTVNQNVNAFDQFGALTKNAGSTVQSPDLGAAVVSLHSFQYLNQYNIRTREVIASAGGKLYRIDSPSSAEALVLGYAEDGSLPVPSDYAGADLGEALSAVQYAERLHLTSPNTTPVKYDGTIVSNWGVQPPGSDVDTEQETFNNAAAFGTPTTINAIDPSIADSSFTIDGGFGSVSVGATHDGSAAPWGIQITSGAFGPSNWTPGSATGLGNFLFCWVFIPSGYISDIDFIQITLEDTATAQDFWQFFPGDLTEGWNLLVLDINSPDGGVGINLALVDHTYFTIQFEDSAASPQGISKFDGVLWGRFWQSSHGAPVGVAAGGGTWTAPGTFDYRVTFLTQYGVESNGGDVSNQISVIAGQKINLSEIPTSSDPQVIARRIYRRDVNSETNWFFIHQIDDNITTLYTDDQDPRDPLSGIPTAGDGAGIDHTPPSAGLDSAVYNDRVFVIDAEVPSVLQVSEVQRAEQFPLVETITFDEDLTALGLHQQGLVIFSRDTTWLLTGRGTADDPFDVQRVSTESGCNGRRAHDEVRGWQVSVSENNVYLNLNAREGVRNNINRWWLNAPVLNQWSSEIPVDQTENTFVVHDRARQSIYFFASGDSGFFQTIWVWEYGTDNEGQVSTDGDGLEPQDVRLGAWRRIVVPPLVRPLCAAVIERDDEFPQLYVGDNNGRVYRWFDPAATDWSLPTGDEVVVAQFRPVSVPAGVTREGRGEPRMLAINAEVAAETEWTVLVECLSDFEGAVLGSSTTSFTIGPSTPAPVIPIPPTQARAYAIRVTLTHNTLAEAGGTIRSLRVGYLPHSTAGGPKEK